MVDDADLAVRNLTYRMFVELGRAPTAHEVAAAGGFGAADVQQSWQRLDSEHALVLKTTAQEIRMANPFSGVPTDHRVWAAGRWWYANCAWDAIGICAVLHEDGHIATSCPDCGDSLEVEVNDRQAEGAGLLFHCLIPASQWWEDIGFT